MEIIEITENEDGSSELHCEFTDKEIQILLNYAVNKILQEKLKEEDVNEQ